jgi:hypothetical protein
VSAVVPHDVPALVYDTRYYGRDYRRNNKYTKRVVDRTPLDVDKVRAWGGVALGRRVWTCVLQTPRIL